MRSGFRVLAISAAAAAALSAGGLGGHVAFAASTTRYVATTGSDNATCDQTHPCQHVQTGVNVANPGDTIRVKAGTYVEQVTITKSVNIVGDGIDATNIQAPAVMTPDTTYMQTYIVEIKGAAATVGITDLTVEGPGTGTGCGPNPTALDNGVAVVEQATLNMYQAAVRNIINSVSLQGCQTGDAISVGKPGGVPSSLAQPAHANLFDVLVTTFQKDGVAARSAGTTLNMFATRIVNQPNPYIASNGVEVLDGALGNVQYDSVSGNECNLVGVCGPDPINNTQASGILTFAADPSTVIANNNVFANDMGIYTDDNIRILNNSDSNNRATGLYVDTDSTNLRALRNTFNADGYYGVTIGPAFPVTAGGTGLPNAGGNTFSQDSAFGNTQYDLYQSAGSGPNHNDDNHCNTAFPSKTYWDCEGSENGGSDGDRDDSGDDGGRGGDHGDSAPANPPESRQD